MNNIRIAILNKLDKLLAFMDNDAPKALHYYNDEFHEYLKGSAYTFKFRCNTDHEDSQNIVEGNKIAFHDVAKNKDYYLNIMYVEKDEYEIRVECYGLLFELLNEDSGPYSTSQAMTFIQYWEIFDSEGSVDVNINEVADRSIKNEWTGTETLLSRLYSLATVFSAEIEFTVELNSDYSLNRIVANIYREHSDECQGMGQNRTDIKLHYGTDISGVTKVLDITKLYTAIRPIGKDGLKITNLNKTEYDENGEVIYQSTSGDDAIRAVQARDNFPSNIKNAEDGYIMHVWEYDTDNVEMLYGQALAELKKISEPNVKYEIEGYVDVNIGDTVEISDEEYKPVLYLRARVIEQIRSFTDPDRFKTVFSNVVELQSEVSEDLIAKMQDLIAENKSYTSSILSDNGTIFKNSEGESTLQVKVYGGGADVTGDFTYKWYKDGTEFSSGSSLKIYANQVSDKAVYKVETVDPSGVVRAISETTVSNVNDGGEPSQYFWHDNNGAHVSTIANSTAGNNLLLTSDGVFIRNGDSVLASFEDDEINIGVYDYTSSINFGGILSLIAEGQGEVSIKSAARPIRRDVLYLLNFNELRHWKNKYKR